MTTSALALLDEPGRLRVALSPIRRQLLDRLRTPASASQLAGELTLARQKVNYHLRALEHAGLVELVEERQRRGCVERILAARAQTFVVDPLVVSGPDTADKDAADRATGIGGSGTAGTVAARRGLVRPGVQDRFAANHLIDSAAATVREVARIQAAADRQGERLLTFTIDTEIRFPTPGDLERFTTALADFLAQQAATLARAQRDDRPRRHDRVQHDDRTGRDDRARRDDRSKRDDRPNEGGRLYRVMVGGHPSPAPASAPAPVAAPKTSNRQLRVRSQI